MATPNVGEIISSTIQARNREYADNMTDNNAILFQLNKRGKVRSCDGGEKIYEEVNFTDNTNAQSYDGLDPLATGAQQVLDTAEFAWKQYAVSIVVSGREKRQNSGRARMIDLVTARIDNARSSLKNKWALDAYADGTGNGGKNLTGLASLVPTDPTTGTVGGINRANFTFWRSQVKDPAITPTSATLLPSMNDLWVSCCRGTDKPHIILADNIMYSMYLGALQPNQRFMDAATAEAGFENVKYNSAPVILDGGIGGNCTASTMFYLNLDYLYWRPHSELNFEAMGEKERDPVNQDGTIRFIGLMGNLTASGLQFSGRFIGT